MRVAAAVYLSVKSMRSTSLSSGAESFHPAPQCLLWLFVIFSQFKSHKR